jgi:hypothetical protein
VPGLIFKALGRHERYEYDGRNDTRIEGHFLHVWGVAFEHGIHMPPNDNCYGFGSKRCVIFYHQAGMPTWASTEATQDYWQAVDD